MIIEENMDGFLLFIGKSLKLGEVGVYELVIWRLFNKACNLKILLRMLIVRHKDFDDLLLGTSDRLGRLLILISIFLSKITELHLLLFLETSSTHLII